MTDQPQGDKPALTVVIQSWWTPAVAVIFLVIGLLGGYFGRPLVAKGTKTSEPVAVVTTPTTDPTEAAASLKQIMDSVISQTTNFKGDPNATVTIIEFSDYQ